MTKQEFVETLAERADLSKADANRALNAILDSLTEAMTDREEVSFTGFGKFLSQRRRAREAVNPQDPSQKIKVKAAHVPKFRPGATLREAVAQLPAADGAQSGSSQSSSGNGRSDGGAERGADKATAAPTPSAGAPGEWRPLADRR